VDWKRASPSSRQPKIASSFAIAPAPQKRIDDPASPLSQSLVRVADYSSMSVVTKFVCPNVWPWSTAETVTRPFGSLSTQKLGAPTRLKPRLWAGSGIPPKIARVELPRGVPRNNLCDDHAVTSDRLLLKGRAGGRSNVTHSTRFHSTNVPSTVRWIFEPATIPRNPRNSMLLIRRLARMNLNGSACRS
jgi:hypothetical protein